MKHFRILSFLGLVFLFFQCTTIKTTQTANGKESGKSKSEVKSIKEVTKRTHEYGGLFNIYQDTITGKIYLEIKKDQLGKEFIYFSHVVNGVSDAGFITGSYRGARIFTINKFFNEIEFQLENTSYYFDKDNALSKAADANINKPLFVNKKIIAVGEEKGSYLVEANDIFLSETFQQVKPSPPKNAKNKNRFSLGKLSDSKSKVRQIKNFPKNTDVIVEMVYENGSPSNHGSTAVTDARFVSIHLQHSIIQVPEDDFKPRFDDPRVGYFTTKVTDMTSPDPTPYRDLIHRWNLEKKDKGAALSEPVKPIVYWIENTTPVELRDIIKAGILRWNEAFEKAGFKNAIQVKIQPDTASWDADDIRYNVIRWTSSPNPAFGGYGPSFVNPKTGEILGADVMLEYIYITKRLEFEKLFGTAALDLDEEYKDPESYQDYCSFGKVMYYNNLFGYSALKAMGEDEYEERELIKQSVYRLVLHEVGHTLGLTHNFKGSLLHSFDELTKPDLIKKTGLTGSVMEYPAVNLSPDKSKQALYYDVKPGKYDEWAIEYGYSEGLEDKEAEKQRLDKILSRSTEPELAYANDADDMRAAGKGIDPTAMIYDLSSDPMEYAIERMGLIDDLIPKLKAKYSENGKSYEELRNAFLFLTGGYGIQATVISRQIGGVYVDRSFSGQNTDKEPFTPVPYDKQKKAMNALSKYIFSEKAFSYPDDLLNYLQEQRRGFDGTSGPTILERILAIQKGILDQLLHKNTLQRISESAMYGNTYKLPEVMGDLTDAIIKDDLNKAVNNIRQNLQQEYIDRLIKIIDEKSGYDHLSQSMAFYELKKIENDFKKAASPDISTAAHRKLALHKISVALKEN